MGNLQGRILEWVATSSSRGSSQPRDRTQVSHIAGRFFNVWATKKDQEYSAYKGQLLVSLGFPGGAGGKEPTCQRGRCKRLVVRALGREGALEEGMTTHSNILAWRIPWTEEPGGLWSIGLQRVGDNWSNLAGTSVITVAIWTIHMLLLRSTSHTVSQDYGPFWCQMQVLLSECTDLVAPQLPWSYGNSN